jgi:hypothetical protein
VTRSEDIAIYRKPFEQPYILECPGYPHISDCMGFKVMDRMSSECDLASCDLVYPGYQVEDSGLACPVRSDEA